MKKTLQLLVRSKKPLHSTTKKKLKNQFKIDTELEYMPYFMENCVSVSEELVTSASDVPEKIITTSAFDVQLLQQNDVPEATPDKEPADSTDDIKANRDISSI